MYTIYRIVFLSLRKCTSRVCTNAITMFPVLAHPRRAAHTYVRTYVQHRRFTAKLQPQCNRYFCLHNPIFSLYTRAIVTYIPRQTRSRRVNKFSHAIRNYSVCVLATARRRHFDTAGEGGKKSKELRARKGWGYKSIRNTYACKCIKMPAISCIISFFRD